MKQWALIVDVDLCINCRNCEIATRDEHAGNDFPGYSAAQPAAGLDVLRVERHVRGEGSRIDVTYIPKTCNHCDNAPCIAAAGEGVIRKRADGIVLVDPDKAAGRRDLVDACPYGMIRWNEETQLPQNWAFDAHLLDAGWEEPRCAQACPTKAIRAVKLEAASLAELVAAQGLSVLRPELGTGPRVFYKNLTAALSHVVTGNLCVRSEDGRLENVAGAELALTDSSDGILRTATTDHFGDFRFSGLLAEAGTLNLTVGYRGREHMIVDVPRSGSIDMGSVTIG